jgi:hypothetical protein
VAGSGHNQALSPKGFTERVLSVVYVDVHFMIESPLLSARIKLNKPLTLTTTARFDFAAYVIGMIEQRVRALTFWVGTTINVADAGIAVVTATRFQALSCLLIFAHDCLCLFASSQFQIL